MKHTKNVISNVCAIFSMAAIMIAPSSIPAHAQETRSATRAHDEVRAEGSQSVKQISVVAWDHIVIHVSDVERSMQFYQTHLGFEVIEDIEFGGEGLAKIMSGNAGGARINHARGRVVFGKIGGQYVELIRLEADGDFQPHEPGISAFSLQVSDIDQAHAAAVANGLNPQTEPVEIEGSRQFFITDPDGIHIELLQPATE